MHTISYLLGIDYLQDNFLKKFNFLKKKQDPTFVPLESRWDIFLRTELRADNLWSILVPKEEKGMSSDTARYIIIPCEMIPYIVINTYDGRESFHIDYNKYGIKKIQEILENTNEIEKLSEIKLIIEKVTRE